MTPRQRKMRTVHAAAREIGLDADDRRALQIVATGKASSADMSEAELDDVLAALKARGWTPKGRKAPAPRGDLRFIHVLWRLLFDAGAVDKGGAEGLNAFVRARFGEAWGSVPADIDMMRDGRQIADVIEALKAMCARHGIAVRDRAR